MPVVPLKEYRAGPVRILIGVTNDGSGWIITPDGEIHIWHNMTPLVSSLNKALEKLVKGIATYQSAKRVEGLKSMKAALEELTSAVNAIKA